MVNILSNIKTRIFQFLDNQGIKKEEFYTKTGISSSNFKGSGLKSDPGGDKIAKILTLYPKINPDWLLKGEGDMLRSQKKYVATSDLPAMANETIAKYKVRQFNFIEGVTDRCQAIEDKLNSKSMSEDQLKALLLESVDLNQELIEQFKDLYQKNLTAIEFINRQFNG